jgi:hypothetical protein
LSVNDPCRRIVLNLTYETTPSNLTTCGRALRREPLKLPKHDEVRAHDARGLYGRDELLFHNCRLRDAWPPRYDALLHGYGAPLPFGDVPLPFSTWLSLPWAVADPLDG